MLRISWNHVPHTIRRKMKFGEFSVRTKIRGKLKKSVIYSVFVLWIGLDAIACIDGQ